MVDPNTRLDDFYLDSPIVSLEWDDVKLWHAVVIGIVWLALWVTISVGLIWLYAVWFAGLVGFETALLVGVALIVLMFCGDS